MAIREPGLTQRDIDISKPHAARMYDYLLGGKDHFAVDRETAERAIKAIPTGRTAARENRTFLGRAVRYLAAEAGIRQFLDIGTGLPSASNVHEVAQSVAPESRVVYVDNDPIVLSHARALLTSTPQGRTSYIEADLREPEKILTHPAARQTIDFSQPVALMLVGILHFVPDEANPAQIVATLLAALPPAATWLPRTEHWSTTRKAPRPGPAPTATAACPSSSAPRTSSPTWRSAAWKWWTPAWSWCRNGGRATATPARCPRKWGSTEQSQENHDPHRPRGASRSSLIEDHRTSPVATSVDRTSRSVVRAR